MSTQEPMNSNPSYFDCVARDEPKLLLAKKNKIMVLTAPVLQTGGGDKLQNIKQLIYKPSNVFKHFAIISKVKFLFILSELTIQSFFNTLLEGRSLLYGHAYLGKLLMLFLTYLINDTRKLLNANVSAFYTFIEFFFLYAFSCFSQCSTFYSSFPIPPSI